MCQHAVNAQNINKLVIDEPVDVAKKFIEQNEYHNATVILNVVINSPVSKGKPFYYEAKMLLAIIRISKKDIEGAKSLYQDILAEKPDHIAARIQLAGIFRLEGKHQQAAFHLELTDVGSLPVQVRGRISEYLNWTRKREGWSFRANFSFMPDTNINSATENDTVSLYGFEFDLSEDAQQTSGVGLRLGGGSTYIKALDDNDYLDFNFDGNYTFYPKNSNFDQGLIMFRGGPRHRFDANNEVNVYFQSYLQRFGGNTYTDSFGAEVSYRKRFDLKHVAQTRFMVQKINNHFDENRNGKRYSTELMFRRYFNKLGFLNFSAGYLKDDLKSKALSSNGFNGGLGGYYIFPKGISINLNAQYVLLNYSDIWGVFGIKRKDKRKILSLELTKRDFDIYGFAPVLGISVTENSSNIDLFQYTRLRSMLSFTRYF